MAGGVKWEPLTYRGAPRPGVYQREGARGRMLYRHVYRDGTGRQVACTKDPATGREHTAADAIERQARMTGADRPDDVAAGRVTLQVVYEEMHAVRDYAPNTVALHDFLWTKHLAGEVGPREVGKLRSKAIDDVLSKIEAPGTQGKARSLLTAMLNFSVRKGHIATSPMRAKDHGDRTRAKRTRIRAEAQNKPERMPSTEEVAQLVAELPERYRALVELMAYVGLRPGEAYALQVGDFDPMRRTLHIERAASKGNIGPTKMGETRTLPLSANLAEMLTEHVARLAIHDQTDADALMFPTEDGKLIHEGNFRNRVFSKAAARAGVNGGITPGDLRHHAAAHAIHHGASVLQVSKMLGHAKPSITLDVYADLFADSLDELADKLDGPTREARSLKVNDGGVRALNV